MRKSLLLLLAVFCTIQLSAQLIITEIMYNPPESGSDSLEYIEIYNTSSADLDLTGYGFAAGVEHEFTGGTIPANGYHVVSVNADALMSVLGQASEQWTDGALSNGGEEIALKDPSGVIINTVTYDNTGDWPGSADGTNGEGASIVLCDLGLDNTLAENWGVSDISTGIEINGRIISGSPGGTNICDTGTTAFMPMSIIDATMVDADGVAINNGEAVELFGVVHGVNFNPDGIQYTLINTNNNEGIGLYNQNEDFNGVFEEGTEVLVRGLITQFRGLTQINVEEVDIINATKPLVDPTVVSSLTEATESSLVTLEGVDFVDPDQWLGDGSSFNVEVTDGTTNFQIRIHAGTNLSGINVPEGLNSITGIGGQFDPDAPFTEGYQLLPRYISDIDADVIEGGGIVYTPVSISDIIGEETDGTASSDGMTVEVTATAYGINFRPGGLQFTIIDDSNNGIGLFSNDVDWGYAMTEGDEVTVWGTVGQFNGLTQIYLDSIQMNSQGNQLIGTSEVTELSETTESSYISFTGSDWVDPAQWAGDGSSFGVEMTNGTTTVTLWIDSDSPWSSAPLPDSKSIVVGIGGQFDPQLPYYSGYQLVALDFMPYLSVDALEVDVFNLSPNPSSSIIQINSDIDFDEIIIYNMMGQEMLTTDETQINISSLVNGNYFVLVRYQDKFSRELFTKF